MTLDGENFAQSNLSRKIIVLQYFKFVETHSSINIYGSKLPLRQDKDIVCIDFSEENPAGIVEIRNEAAGAVSFL